VGARILEGSAYRPGQRSHRFVTRPALERIEDQLTPHPRAGDIAGDVFELTHEIEGVDLVVDVANCVPETNRLPPRDRARPGAIARPRVPKLSQRRQGAGVELDPGPGPFLGLRDALRAFHGVAIGLFDLRRIRAMTPDQQIAADEATCILECAEQTLTPLLRRANPRGRGVGRHERGGRCERLPPAPKAGRRADRAEQGHRKHPVGRAELIVGTQRDRARGESRANHRRVDGRDQGIGVALRAPAPKRQPDRLRRHGCERCDGQPRAPVSMPIDQE
jgi:hypothetical protein